MEAHLARRRFLIAAVGIGQLLEARGINLAEVEVGHVVVPVFLVALGTRCRQFGLGRLAPSAARGAQVDQAVEILGRLFLVRHTETVGAGRKVGRVEIGPAQAQHGAPVSRRGNFCIRGDQFGIVAPPDRGLEFIPFIDHVERIGIARLELVLQPWIVSRDHLGEDIAAQVAEIDHALGHGYQDPVGAQEIDTQHQIGRRVRAQIHHADLDVADFFVADLECVDRDFVKVERSLREGGCLAVGNDAVRVRLQADRLGDP